MTPRPDEAGSEAAQMDPAVLLFLLYLMIIHELVSGWMEYQKQAAKPKKQAGPPWSGSSSSQGTRSSVSHSLAYPVPRERCKDWRKAGRIIRKA